MADIIGVELDASGTGFVPETEQMNRLQSEDYPEDFIIVKFSVSLKKKQGRLIIIPKYKKIKHLKYNNIGGKQDFDDAIEDIFRNRPGQWRNCRPNPPMRNSLSLNIQKYSVIVFIIEDSDLFFREDHEAFRVEKGKTDILLEDNRVIVENGKVTSKPPGTSAPDCKMAYFLSKEQADNKYAAFNIYVRVPLDIEIDLGQPTNDPSTVQLNVVIDPVVGHPGGNSL